MNCKYHKNKQSEYICSVCNQPICQECMTEVNSKKVCQTCVEKNLFGYRNSPKGASKFWSFIFSLIPGCGQMYMGLMNRGLQLLTAFAGIFILGVMTEGVIIALGIIIWFYSFFDSLHIRKQVLQGEMVEDISIYNMNMDSLNPKYIGYALVALGGLTVMKNMTSFIAHTANTIFGNRFPTYWIYDIYRNSIPLALLIIGIILITRAHKAEKPLKELIDDEIQAEFIDDEEYTQITDQEKLPE